MLLNLQKILCTPSAKEDFSISLELTSVRFMGNEYPVKDKQDVIIHAENIGKNKVDVKGSTILTLNLTCDRCLEDVPWECKIEFEKEYDKSDANDEWNQESFIEGNNLDVDGLIYEELIQKIPMKVLCSEECKGICPVCGVNRNKEQCDCDQSVPDPRMAAIQDICNKFKEVQTVSICPKNKSSKGRRDKRRANWKMSAPTLVKCSKCGELMMPHRVCKACGSYNKKEIITVK